MAEVYADRGTHKTAVPWIALAVIAAIVIALLIAYAR